MADKTWVTINGWCKYEVSEYGEVRNKETGHILTTSVDDKGYPYVNLQIKGKRKNYKIHRLLAECFIPKVEGNPIVNHKDGNKMNWSLDNLEWTTSRENNLHALENGLRTRTSNKPVIATHIESGKEYLFDSGAACARYIGTSRGNVSRVLIGKRKSAKGYTFRYAEEVSNCNGR